MRFIIIALLTVASGRKAQPEREGGGLNQGGLSASEVSTSQLSEGEVVFDEPTQPVIQSIYRQKTQHAGGASQLDNGYSLYVKFKGDPKINKRHVQFVFDENVPAAQTISADGRKTLSTQSGSLMIKQGLSESLKPFESLTAASGPRGEWDNFVIKIYSHTGQTSPSVIISDGKDSDAFKA